MLSTHKPACETHSRQAAAGLQRESTSRATDALCARSEAKGREVAPHVTAKIQALENDAIDPRCFEKNAGHRIPNVEQCCWLEANDESAWMPLRARIAVALWRQADARWKSLKELFEASDPHMLPETSGCFFSETKWGRVHQWGDGSR